MGSLWEWALEAKFWWVTPSCAGARARAERFPRCDRSGGSAAPRGWAASDSAQNHTWNEFSNLGLWNNDSLYNMTTKCSWVGNDCFKRLEKLNERGGAGVTLSPTQCPCWAGGRGFCPGSAIEADKGLILQWKMCFNSQHCTLTLTKEWKAACYSLGMFTAVWQILL